MKHGLILLSLLLPLAAAAQVRIPKDANRFEYRQFDYGEQTDTATFTLERQLQQVRIVPQQPVDNAIAGYVSTETVMDYGLDSITVSASYTNGDRYYYRTPFSRSDIAWQREEAKGLVRYTCSINSNTLVFEMDERCNVGANPLPYYGLNKGVLVSFTRNGQRLIELAKAERLKKPANPWPAQTGQRVTPRELDRIMKERLVVTTRIFDHEQICWGKPNDTIAGEVPFDSVLHYAGGTVIVKRVRLPRLAGHYQYFLELHQQSNGDAYDRTGSVFVLTPGFFDGVNRGVDRLPQLVGRDGERYQGIAATGTYRPAVELMRFFTPFGVGHFNQRMQADGTEWRPEAYYKQEVSDMADWLHDDVLIGIFIGNYDAGGHLVTLDLKAYPNSHTADAPLATTALPLFNTCNVLEMASQNYGKLFATDSLSVTFTIPAHASARLRYIATGHGGWGEGDEFVPKQNTILIDGRQAFTHTPWRGDCGTYRDFNPVSGNFWNGLSSSDLSRSGWCPGKATQPVYFDLSPWADGQQHTLTVAIPQGKPVEGMFSHWCVSGTLIIEPNQ